MTYSLQSRPPDPVDLYEKPHRTISYQKWILVLFAFLSVALMVVYRGSFIPKPVSEQAPEQASEPDVIAHKLLPPVSDSPIPAEPFLAVPEATDLKKILVLCVDSVECRKFTLFLGQLPNSVVLMDLPTLPPRVQSDDDEPILLVSPSVKYLIIKTVPCQKGDLCESVLAFHPDHTFLFIQDPSKLYSQILSGSALQYNFTSVLPKDSPRSSCKDPANIFIQADVWWGDSLIGNLPISWFAYEHFLNSSIEIEVVDAINKLLLSPSATPRFHPLVSITRSLKQILDYNRKHCLLSSTSTSPSESLGHSSFEDLEKFLGSGTSDSPFRWQVTTNKQENGTLDTDFEKENQPKIRPDDPQVSKWVDQWSPKLFNFYSTLKKTGNPFPKWRISKNNPRCV